MTINERVSDATIDGILSGVIDGVEPTTHEIAMAAEIKQYRAAAACPAVWVRYGDANHAPDCTLDNDEAREWAARGLDVVRMVSPINAAPQVTSVSALIQFAEFMAAEAIKSGDYPDGWQCKASNAAHDYAQACRVAAEPVTVVLSSRAGNDTSTIDKALPEGFKLYADQQVTSVPTFDDLRDAVAEMTGGIPYQWPNSDKGHQPVPFMNFNSLGRIVDKFSAAPAVQAKSILRDFYSAYDEWINSGAPEGAPFSRCVGLCANLFDYISSTVLEGLHAEFVAAGFDEKLPFNASASEYTAESERGECHINPARVAWVRVRIAEAAAPEVQAEQTKRLIGWRTTDYTEETSDPEMAKNWAAAVGVLPIFEGDINTRLQAEQLSGNTEQVEPVTDTNRLPFERWLSQLTGKIDVDCGCVTTEAFFHWLRVAYDAGDSPVIPDGWKLAPKEATPGMLNASWISHGVYHPSAYRTMLEAAPDFREIQNSSTNNCRESSDSSTKCWIPVSERMPETMTSVLVTGTWFHHAVSFWDGASWCDLDYEPPVTHWMPLPAAPKQEAE